MKHAAIVAEMQKNRADPVRTVDASVATDLINDGLARKATIDPAPPEGKVAINLTVAGRSYSAPERQSQGKPAPTATDTSAT